MSPRDMDFLRRLLKERPLKRVSGPTAREFLLEHNIGRFNGRVITYTQEDFTRAANLLRDRGIATQASSPSESI